MFIQYSNWSGFQYLLVILTTIVFRNKRSMPVTPYMICGILSWLRQPSNMVFLSSISSCQTAPQPLARFSQVDIWKGGKKQDEKEDRKSRGNINPKLFVPWRVAIGHAEQARNPRQRDKDQGDVRQPLDISRVLHRTT